MEQTRLDCEEFTVLVVGEFGRGKSALVNALVAAPVCGVSARTPTAVPTFIRYGAYPQAAVVIPASGEDASAKDARPAPAAAAQHEVPVAEVAKLSLCDHDDRYGSYAALHVELPRELLRDGLVLVDTPGVGGGLAAAGAARTVRALSFADALLFVTDASAELSAPELEFLQEALRVCPVAVFAVTKCDLYPEWRRLVELNRAHLVEAGLSMPVLPLSSALRELALDIGDRAMAAESGFPVLSRALSDGLRRRQRGSRCRAAVTVGVTVLEQLSAEVAAEQLAVSDPSRRADQMRGLREAEQRAAKVHSGAARWQEVLADKQRALRRAAAADLSDRFQTVRDSARGKINAGDPVEQWSELEPWLNRELNRQLAAHHRRLLAHVHDVAAAVAGQFDADVGELPLDLPLTPAREWERHVQRPEDRRTSWLDMVVTAARGFSISSSVTGVLLFAVSAPAALISAPLTAALGTFFAVRSVRSLRQAQLHAARQQAERAVLGFLAEEEHHTGRLDDELLDMAYVSLRNAFMDLSAQLQANARAVVAAASRAAETDDAGGSCRESLTQRRIQLDTLRRSADRALHPAGPEAARMEGRA